MFRPGFHPCSLNRPKAGQPGQRVYRNDLLMIEHVVERGVPRDVSNPGKHLITPTTEPDRRTHLDSLTTGVIKPDLRGFTTRGNEVEMALINPHPVSANRQIGWAGVHEATKFPAVKDRKVLGPGSERQP